MIRIALVEDEAEVRAQLQGYVQRHTRQYGTEFAVTEFADGMELLDDYRPVYDILFLDVEMKHLDGMETARRVRELDKDVIIVFITNMAQYAIGGYAVGALDYVQVTDQKGNTYERNRAMKCFDTTKPTLNAAVSDGLLVFRCMIRIPAQRRCMSTVMSLQT